MAVKIEKMFDFPGPQPNGMQATGDGIWFLDQVSNQALLVSYEGETLKAIDTDSEHGSGVTVDGTNLWLASTFVPTRIEADGPVILKVDPETGKTLASYPTAGAKQSGAHGLEWRDDKLWMAVPPSATVYQLDPENDLAVLHSFPAPGVRPHGLAWEGDDIWCVETNHRAFYRMSLKDGSTIDKIEIPEPHPEPHGMTRWDGCFWYCDAGSGAVCRVSQ